MDTKVKATYRKLITGFGTLIICIDAKDYCSQNSSTYCFKTLITCMSAKGSEGNFCEVKTLIFYMDAKGQVFIYKNSPCFTTLIIHMYTKRRYRSIQFIT